MKHKGFTIVELLIVIVVIAILAAISIVAYTSIQNNARYTSHLTSLQQMKRALDVYYAQNGEYPVTQVGSAINWRYGCDYTSNPIELIPSIEDVVNTLPEAPCEGGSRINDTWLYGSNGTGYKLIYLRAANAEGRSERVPDSMRDKRWNDGASGTSWGYWANGYDD